LLIARLLNGRKVFSLTRRERVARAARLMAEHRIGAVVIVDVRGALEGIFAERDLLAGLYRAGGSVLRDPVSRWMRRDPPSVSPQASVLEAMRLITEARARHLPVVEEGRVTGLLSVGDLLKCRLDEQAQENMVLREMARWPRPLVA
jgi:CBS domain-containing protein